MHDAPWTVHELLGQLRLALAGLPLPADPRVRRQPDLRVFRYYVARGLVDRPLHLRGRIGLYGPRHLHQLLAIRRLQAQGSTLHEIHQRLRELDEPELARLASAPPMRPPTSPSDHGILALADGVSLRFEGAELTSPSERRRLRRLAQPLLRRVAALGRRAEEST